MKKNIGGFRGPKVQYFNHNLGVVNARKSKFKTVFLPVMMTLMVMSGGAYGFSKYEQTAAYQNADTMPVVVAEKTQKQEIDKDQKPRQAREDKDLTKAIEKKVKAMPRNTSWSVSVRDLNSDRMANINANESVDAATLTELFLLAPLEKKQTADNWKYRLGNKTIEGCVIAMLSENNEDCQEAVTRYAGAQNINPHNQGLGFKNTNINDKAASTTTARDLSELLYRLQNSQILSDKARRAVFDGLYAQTHKEGIAKGCGNACLVGGVMAENETLKHEVAVVTHGKSKYIVVIMSSGTTWAQLSDLARTIDEEVVALVP